MWYRHSDYDTRVGIRERLCAVLSRRLFLRGVEMKRNTGNSDTFLLRFLYGTALGRLCLKGLVQPGVSKAAGRFLSLRASKWLASYYIRKHGIDLKDIEIPPGGFASFNDFFTRKRKSGCAGAAAGTLLSPCDGFLTCVKIGADTVFSIKNTRFSLEDLLKDQKLAARFQRGIGLVFRLTPANYHRFCYGAKGQVLCSRVIPGKLHCVRPVALRNIPVFVQNAREYQVLAAEGFGAVVQMEIGALLVGKIRNERKPLPGETVGAGEEKGYFEFGGSTILLLLSENAVHFTKTFREKGAEYQRKGKEIPVRMGEVIGVSRKL